MYLIDLEPRLKSLLEIYHSIEKRGLLHYYKLSLVSQEGRKPAVLHRLNAIQFFY